MNEGAARSAALQRLAASRARLAGVLLPARPDADGDPAGRRGAGWAGPRRWRALWRAWTRSGALAPVFAAVEQGLAGWWQRQPWRDTAQVASELGGIYLRPVIRRHPWAAIGLGAAAGAALAAAQPWRWRAWRVQARRSSRQALGWALGQLSQPAIQLLLAGLLVQKSSERATAETADTAASGPVNGPARTSASAAAAATSAGAAAAAEAAARNPAGTTSGKATGTASTASAAHAAPAQV